MSGAEMRLPVADSAASARALGTLARPERPRLIAAIAMLVAGTICELAGPLLLGRIVDLVADGKPASAITTPVLALLAATMLGALLVATGSALLAEGGERALDRLRERVVAHALALPLERVERAGAGDLHARVSEDVGEVAEAVRSAVPAIAASALTVGLTVVGLAAIDPRFALAGVCAVPIQVFAARRYLRDSPRLYARERSAAAARGERLLSTFSGLQTLRSTGLGDRQAERIRARSLDELDLTIATIRLRTDFYARLNAAELVGLGALLIAGFLLVRSGNASIGEATAAALLFIRLFDPINVLLALLDDLQQGMASLARLVGVLRTPAPIDPERPATPRDASLALRGIGHEYTRGHPVLDGVDLDIAAGERVALVGLSGAGKSTLARIAAGTLAPTAGDLRLGGKTFSALGPTATRANVALITQEIHVFAGSLRDDLRLGRPEASDEALEQALQRVGALEWAQTLPDGLRTAVGDGGVTLSAMQSQQLALARLVLADPPIAILDEATAEAGSAGARVLERAADAALAGRTALVVAHRLSQAVGADRVVVLERGRIVEDAPHGVLVRAGGPYAALWSSWSGAR